MASSFLFFSFFWLSFLYLSANPAEAVVGMAGVDVVGQRGLPSEAVVHLAKKVLRNFSVCLFVCLSVPNSKP